MGMLPQIEERRIGLFDNFNAILAQDTESSGLLVTVVTDDAADDLGDTLRGVAIWKLPEASMSWKAGVSLKYAITKAFGLSAKIYDYFKIQEHIHAIHSECQAKHPTSPCWVLDLLGVDPTCQLKGYGLSLVKPVIQAIDADNGSSFLGTLNPNSVPFFEKLGYQLVKEFTYDVYKIVCMYRPPVQPPQDGQAPPAQAEAQGVVQADGLDNRLLEDGPLVLDRTL